MEAKLTRVVATHQKTQQGLKQEMTTSAHKIERVATHQKTQQGLKEECAHPMEHTLEE